MRSVYAADSHVAVGYRVQDGDPATEILGVAREAQCDLIAMGTLMGSVAEQVVRKAPCPVLTVKVPLPSTGLRVASLPAEVGKPL